MGSKKKDTPNTKFSVRKKKKEKRNNKYKMFSGLFKKSSPTVEKVEGGTIQPQNPASAEKFNSMHSELNFAEDQQVGNENLFKEANPQMFPNEPEVASKNYCKNMFTGVKNYLNNADRMNQCHSELNYAEDWGYGNESMFKEANPGLFKQYPKLNVKV